MVTCVCQFFANGQFYDHWQYQQKINKIAVTMELMSTYSL